LAVGVAAEVKNKLAVVDVVGESVTLKKAGTTYKGLCPFHGEKTPSFVVTPQRETWHCFGCGLGGDIFSFVMQRDGVTFPEALRTLAQEKLVEVYPRRGIFVTSVEVRDLASLSEVRGLLESAAARLAAERATREERREATTLISELDGNAGEHDERRLIDLDQRIHRHIYRCAHNPFLEETLNEYYVLTLRIWFLALDRVARLDEAVGEHRDLMEAIRDGDGPRAEETMRRHIQGFEQAIRQVL